MDIFLPSLRFFFILLLLRCYVNAVTVAAHRHGGGSGERPLSKIAIHKAAVHALHGSASIRAYPLGEDAQWLTVKLNSPVPSEDDWVGVLSPAKFKLAHQSVRQTTQDKMLHTYMLNSNKAKICGCFKCYNLFKS